MNNLLNSYPIYIATKEWQIRTHHKKRINKKWRKRYGVFELNYMPHGQVALIDGTLWMTRKTYNELRTKLPDYYAKVER